MHFYVLTHDELFRNLDLVKPRHFKDNFVCCLKLSNSPRPSDALGKLEQIQKQHKKGNTNSKLKEKLNKHHLCQKINYYSLFFYVPSKLLGYIQLYLLKSRPCENCLEDFCTSARLEALKVNLLYPKKSFQKC